MVSFTALALLASTAIAGPIASESAIPKGWTWLVEGWSGGCARSGCYYDFKITIPSVKNGPAGVKASCSGSESGYDSNFSVPSTFRTCQLLEGVNNGVAARFNLRDQIRPGQGASIGPKKIEVSFSYADRKTQTAYNFTGSHDTVYNQFVAPEQNFTITPTHVTTLAWLESA